MRNADLAFIAERLARPGRTNAVRTSAEITRRTRISVHRLRAARRVAHFATADSRLTRASKIAGEFAVQDGAPAARAKNVAAHPDFSRRTSNEWRGPLSLTSPRTTARVAKAVSGAIPNRETGFAVVQGSLERLRAGIVIGNRRIGDTVRLVQELETLSSHRLSINGPVSVYSLDHVVSLGKAAASRVGQTFVELILCNPSTPVSVIARRSVPFESELLDGHTAARGSANGEQQDCAH